MRHTNDAKQYNILLCEIWIYLTKLEAREKLRQKFSNMYNIYETHI